MHLLLSPLPFMLVIPAEPALSEAECGDLLLSLPLPVLSPPPKICHFDRSSSRCLRTAQRRNPLLYPYRPCAETSPLLLSLPCCPVAQPQKPVKPPNPLSPTFQSTSPLPSNYPPPATIEVDTKREPRRKPGLFAFNPKTGSPDLTHIIRIL